MHKGNLKDIRFIEELKSAPDIDPDKYDGSYELVRETVEALSTVPHEQLDINDLDLLYLMAVGTWRCGVDTKLQRIKDSHLNTIEKQRLSSVLENVKGKAVQHSYENFAEEGRKTGWSIGMFGTGFQTFASKADTETAQRFISLCVELKDMDDDEAMFVKAENAVKKGIKGMQSAAASIMLHCLKPCTFPIINSSVNDILPLFQLEGVSLVKPNELWYYIQNSRELKKFRDEKCVFKNYRAMDLKLSVYFRVDDTVYDETAAKNETVPPTGMFKDNGVSNTEKPKINEILALYKVESESYRQWHDLHKKTCDYMAKIHNSLENGKSLDESIQINGDNDLGITDLDSFYNHYWKKKSNGISNIGHGFFNNKDYSAILRFSYKNRDFKQLNIDIILDPENEYEKTIEWFQKCKEVNKTKMYKASINRFFAAVDPYKVSTVVDENCVNSVMNDLDMDMEDKNWFVKNTELMSMLPEPDDEFDVYYRGEFFWYYYEQIKNNRIDTLLLPPSRTSLNGIIDENGFNEFDQTIIENDLERFGKFVSGKGFNFSEELLNNYIFSLKTKPFVILSGISGTGKTKIAQLFVEFMSHGGTSNDSRCCFISVRPDWNDNRGLLGFYNPITEHYQPTELLKLLLRAARDNKNPYFVILDEMNLAKVEYYFSDFLSCMESRRMGNDGLIHSESIILHDCNNILSFKDADGFEYMIPKRLEIPLNVYFTGTINVDESTYMFSPKVLDRANVIEFNDVDMESYRVKIFGNNRTYKKDVLKADKEFVKYFTDNGRFSTRLIRKAFKPEVDLCYERLMTLNSILLDYHMHFGFRVIDEILMYLSYSYEYYKDTPWSDYDIQLLQKVLPKLHGNRKQLEVPLARLMRYCFNADHNDKTPLSADERHAVFEYDYSGRIKEQSETAIIVLPDTIGTGSISTEATAIFPRTAAKLCRMIDILDKQGYTSFIE